MEYLRKKYNGFSEVSVDYLQHELLLNDHEFKEIKGEVRKAVECNNCPQFISFGLFESLVVSHLLEIYS